MVSGSRTPDPLPRKIVRRLPAASRHQVLPATFSAKAVANAVSCSRSKRPAAPPWPASMLVRKTSRLSSVLRGAQPRHPLRRLPVGDARVGEAGERQDRRIGLRRDVVVGRIGGDQAVVGLAGDRVAPFRPFGRRQRQRVVEHGGQHVDERHLGDEAGEEVRRHVGDGADQQAAGRAAPADDAAARR